MGAACASAAGAAAAIRLKELEDLFIAAGLLCTAAGGLKSQARNAGEALHGLQ